MNPWDPNQAPVMTLAPLANAMQAYQQQWLMQQQAGGQNQEGNSNSSTNAGQQNTNRQPDGQHPIAVVPELLTCLLSQEILFIVIDKSFPILSCGHRCL